MKMKKRIISLILSAVMCLGLLPGTVLAAGGEAVGDALSGIKRTVMPTSEYVTQSATRSIRVPLLNVATMNDRYVQSEYIFKDNGLLNGGKNFQLYDWNSVNMYQPPQLLSDAYSHEFLRNNNNSTWRARYKWSFSSSADRDFLDLVQSGQISFLFSADLKYDRHTKLFKHAHTKKSDLAVARLYSRSESNQYMELISNESTQSNRTWYPP